MTPRRRRVWPALLATLMALVAILVALPDGHRSAEAQGVGRATWTPASSTTTTVASRFLVDDDAIVYRTDAVWDQAQADGLARYLADGLRYTHEINDRSGRLDATGYWATNHPDPAYDRDDDDGDGRWEEAEITTGLRPPEVGRVYSSLVQFSRWHGKRSKGACDWAWDRRLGEAEVLSQLSRSLLGEWQAERYTLTYQSLPYERVGTRPAVPGTATPARCREARPGPSQSGVVVTFGRPMAWSELMALPSLGAGRWTAFEAIGSGEGDELVWTCGGPVRVELELAPCRDLGVAAEGIVAAAGYFDGAGLDELRGTQTVARVAALQDTVTDLLFQVGAVGVERPGLSVNDAWWELHPAGR